MQDLELAVGVNNMFNIQTPGCVSCDVSSNFDPNIYDTPGRYYYARISVKMGAGHQAPRLCAAAAPPPPPPAAEPRPATAAAAAAGSSAGARPVRQRNRLEKGRARPGGAFFSAAFACAVRALNLSAFAPM